MNRRQFIAACLMLLVAVCLLDLERLREWWSSIGGDELKAFADTLDGYEFRFTSYAQLICHHPGAILRLEL